MPLGKRVRPRVQSTTLCACGCGQFTYLPPQTHRAHGWIKGQPMRWLKGHGRRRGRSTNDYNERGGVRAHVFVARQALGKPLPAGTEVHHIDGNKQNNIGRNLVICQDHAYHILLHARTRVLKAGGNPNTERVCSTCREIKPLAAFAADRRKSTGTNTQCRACASAAQRQQRFIRLLEAHGQLASGYGW